MGSFPRIWPIRVSPPKRTNRWIRWSWNRSSRPSRSFICSFRQVSESSEDSAFHIHSTGPKRGLSSLVGIKTSTAAFIEPLLPILATYETSPSFIHYCVLDGGVFTYKDRRLDWSIATGMSDSAGGNCSSFPPVSRRGRSKAPRVRNYKNTRGQTSFISYRNSSYGRPFTESSLLKWKEYRYVRQSHFLVSWTGY